MNDQDAKSFVEHRVSRETFGRLASLVCLVLSESTQQNLVSKSTQADMWSRHVLDSLQLLDHVPSDGLWLDVGSGGGFPGLVVAAASTRPVVLVEPRRLRAGFLEDAVRHLALEKVSVHQSTIESLRDVAPRVISARAVAPLSDLFRAAHHLASDATVWVLPKGRNAASELAVAREAWQGEFEMRASLTDPTAMIIVACDVRPKKSVMR